MRCFDLFDYGQCMAHPGVGPPPVCLAPRRPPAFSGPSVASTGWARQPPFVIRSLPSMAVFSVAPLFWLDRVAGLFSFSLGILAFCILGWAGLFPTWRCQGDILFNAGRVLNCLSWPPSLPLFALLPLFGLGLAFAVWHLMLVHSGGVLMDAGCAATRQIRD